MNIAYRVIYLYLSAVPWTTLLFPQVSKVLYINHNIFNFFQTFIRHIHAQYLVAHLPQYLWGKYLQTNYKADKVICQTINKYSPSFLSHRYLPIIQQFHLLVLGQVPSMHTNTQADQHSMAVLTHTLCITRHTHTHTYTHTHSHVCVCSTPLSSQTHTHKHTHTL